MKRAIDALRSALNDLGLQHAYMFFAQNDGTTASSNYISRFPIFTVLAPVSNSIRGAYVLTGIPNAIVIDTGGTTSNIGVLTRGYPRESSGLDVTSDHFQILLITSSSPHICSPAPSGFTLHGRGA